MASLKETVVSKSITLNTDPAYGKTQIFFDSNGIVKGDGIGGTSGDDQTFIIKNRMRGPAPDGSGNFINDVVISAGYDASGMYYEKEFNFSARNGITWKPTSYNQEGSHDTTINIGSSTYPWYYVYTRAVSIGYGGLGFSTLTQTSSGLSYSGISPGHGIIPAVNSTSTTTGYNLGNSISKWRYLYAYSGTIQSSDKSTKDSIHYLDSSISPKLRNVSANSNSGITAQDVIDFCKSIRPVTFCYKDGNGEATEENSKPEMIQLGLIADDIADTTLFKYIGVEDEVKEVDKEGNPIEGTEHTSRGLQLLPLTVVALTACKNLISRVEKLESKLNS